MAEIEDILREQTFKDQCDDNEHRIFYTLTDKKDLQIHRLQKTLTLLVVHLQNKGLISEADLDEILLESLS